jgi:transcription initiation factor TFIID subunit 1
LLQDKLLCPVEDKSQSGNREHGENNDMGPKVADWRFGPAQVWYDMLEVPETGDGFNYGFKLKDKVHRMHGVIPPLPHLSSWHGT